MVTHLSMFNSRVFRHLSSNFPQHFQFMKSASTSCAFQRNLSIFFLQDCSYSLLLAKNSLLRLNMTPNREKKTAPWDTAEERESDSDSDDEENLKKKAAKVTGLKVLQIQVDSLRVDAIIKNGLGMSRNKVDVLFYEDRIRLNGKKVKKKSENASIGDEVDVIKEFSPDNPKFIIVSRVEVVKARPSGDYLLLTVKRHKNLLIQNYEDDPWEESEKPVPEKNNKNEIKRDLS